ncbi:MAG: peptide ABC transporter substrate-binding protein, partial [Bacillota bacterium]
MKCRMRVLVLLLVLLMAAPAVSGCGKKTSVPAQPAKPQVLKLNLGEEPPDLDPGTSHDSVSFQV